MYRFALISLLLSGLVQAAELPSDLQWQSNWQDPVFASDEAKRGGTLRSYMLSFPQTLRSVCLTRTPAFAFTLWMARQSLLNVTQIRGSGSLNSLMSGRFLMTTKPLTSN